MKKTLRSNGIYFNTYNIYDDNNKLKGLLEIHNVDVKKEYFIAWCNLKPFCGSYKGKTKHFENEVEAINEILKNEV